MTAAAAFDLAFDKVHDLVRDFVAGQDRFFSAAYQEAEVRKDYIDKFMAALGWDVNHDIQRNPFEQEVKVEHAVATGSAQRKADYAFFIKPNFRDVRFLLEAKKPHDALETADNCFQVNRYGWYKQIPVAALTDFKELRLIDCRYKPDIGTALGRTVRRYHFQEYADKEKFAEIYWLMSREAVGEGSLEKFAANLPKRRGPAKQRNLFPGGFQNIDESFLDELEQYRLILARAFKKGNPDLDSAALTELTQRAIDRLVFMRFLEDKQIEPVYFVADFGKRHSAWADFVATSRRMDVVYNGIVFKRHEIMDAADFRVDDDVFGDLCASISHLNTVYDFNEIPIHILGSIYERFLSNVIRLTDGGQVRIDRSPETRRAGGVYYTPRYIVRYIVQNTVGALIAGKTPGQIAKMRFADIACGSGSFLLEIYDLLLDYHARYYNEHKDAADPGDYVEAGGTLRLSLKKKRQILLNNVYGADIDQQAVEVTELSLYLRFLEDETIGSVNEDRLLLHVTTLPSLRDNVTCGNSVIGPDISLFPETEGGEDGNGGWLLDPEEEKLLNPMSFRDRFSDVIPSPGFDAIVGNPPYVRPHKLSAVEKKYLWGHYRTFTHKADLYCCFMERATQLLRNGGKFSYIVSDGWLALNSFQNLRKLVLENYRVERLVQLPYKVFKDATVKTGIFVFAKDASSRRRAKSVIEVLEGCLTSKGPVFTLKREIPQAAYEKTFQNVFDLNLSPETEAIKEKMRRGPAIGSLFRVCFGLKTGDDEKFLHHTKGLHPEDRTLLRGDDVRRYGYEYKGEYVWYVPDKMRKHRTTARPGEAARFEQPKVMVKDTSAGFAGTFEDGRYYAKDVLIVIPHEGGGRGPDLRFVAGVINSRALFFYYRTTFQTIHVQNEELASLPLPPLDLENPADKKKHDALVRLVVKMLETEERLAEAQSDRDRDFYTGARTSLDRSIDEAVYGLYGLAKEEVGVIERALADGG